MPTNKYGVDVPAGVLHHLNRKKGVTFRELADQHDLTVGQVAGAIRTYDPNDKETEPAFKLFSLGERLIFDDENCIVVGDVQLPTTDWEFAKLPAEIAKKHIKGDKVLYIMGDWVNVDALSKYDEIVTLPSWDDEVAASRFLFAEYLKVFDEIRIFPGNHERRWQKHLPDPSLARLFDQLLPIKGRERIVSSVFDRCTVHNSTGKWVFLHGANYSQNPLTNANKYASKFNAHIISHHEHKAAMGMSKWGDHFIIDNGGLFDASKMAYVQVDTNTKPNMAQAFTMLKKGHPYLFASFTDWEYWL